MTPDDAAVAAPPSTAPGAVDPDGLWLDDLAEGMTFRSRTYEVTEAVIDEIRVSRSRPDRATVHFSYATVTEDGQVRQQTTGDVLVWRRPPQRS